jgi:uncharacterized lipoprotein
MQIRALAIALALGSALSACETYSGTQASHTGGDRRVEALKGADSAASPNVDATAAKNQVQIPDYPPADTDQAPAAAGKAPSPR